jgi:hypothetical protein
LAQGCNEQCQAGAPVHAHAHAFPRGAFKHFACCSHVDPTSHRARRHSHRRAPMSRARCCVNPLIGKRLRRMELL